MGEAKNKATTEHKQLFILFTGSDWNTSCMALLKYPLKEQEVLHEICKFSVPVQIDFPCYTKQSREIQIQNLTLRDVDYKITSFPTIIITDEVGRPLLRMSGRRKAEDIILFLHKAREQATLLDRIHKTQGDEQYTLIGKFLDCIPDDYDNYYPELWEILEKDVDNISGYRDEHSNKQEYSRAMERVAQFLLQYAQSRYDELDDDAQLSVFYSIKEKIQDNGEMVRAMVEQCATSFIMHALRNLYDETEKYASGEISLIERQILIGLVQSYCLFLLDDTDAAIKQVDKAIALNEHSLVIEELKKQKADYKTALNKKIQQQDKPH